MILSSWSFFFCLFFFFFQAEDGIRDGTVTGVQTCALPILGKGALPRWSLVCLRFGIAFVHGSLPVSNFMGPFQIQLGKGWRLDRLASRIKSGTRALRQCSSSARRYSASRSSPYHSDGISSIS